MAFSERQNEILKTPMTFGPTVGGAGQVNSGDSSATISSNAVTSAGLIFLTARVSATTSPSWVGSGQGFALAVNSVVERISFAVVTGGATATTAPLQFNWFLTNNR